MDVAFQLFSVQWFNFVEHGQDIHESTNFKGSGGSGSSIYFLFCRVSTLKDFFLFKEIFAIGRKKKEIQNKRKYEGNFKKLKRIETTLISTNVTQCNYLCNHKYSV